MKKALPIALLIVSIVACVHKGNFQRNILSKQFEKTSLIEGKEYSILRGKIKDTLVLNSTTNYIIDGDLSVSKKGVLIIEEGVRLYGCSDYDEARIIVEKKGKLYVNGSLNKPIYFGSLNKNKRPGDIAGIIICGEAINNFGEDIIRGEFQYGGDNNDCSSGSINHLIIEYAGGKDQDLAGLCLFSVGSKTSISNLRVLNSSDDGIKIHGGALSIENLIVERCLDDAIDITMGYQGLIKNAQLNLDEKVADVFVEITNNEYSLDRDKEPYSIVELENVKFLNSNNSKLKNELFKSDKFSSIIQH